MKRFTITVALAVMMAMPVFAEHVDPETARKVATTFLNNNGAKAVQLTDLTKTIGFPNLYVFTTEEEFVVMSADDCVKPILGYSLMGKFVAEGMPENLRWWLQGYSDQIQDIVDNKHNDISATTEWQSLKNGSFSKSVSEVIVAPLLTTTWDQNYPYNYYCPSASNGPGGHVYAGCVATAMAQVMKFWNYPTIGNSSYSYTHTTYGEQTANFGETTYEWENMPNSISSSSNQTNIDAIATLIYHCGVAVDMNYGPATSGASSNKVPSGLINYFNYAPSATYVSRDGYEDDQWIAFLQSELIEGRPVFYSGSYTFLSNGELKYGGHAFVCDGYRSDNYFHFNWGWSGSDGHGNNNGYWLIGDLHPGSGGSGSGSGTYNLNNSVVAWVEPISNLTAPTLTVSVSNNNATLTWNAIDDATSYDVYKDNAKIATDLTSLSYVDSNIGFGQYPEYYLRAKNSTTKSNPSNRVTATGTYHNLIPQNPNATIAVSDNSVNLTWTEPQVQSMDMHYGTGQIGSHYGSNVSEGTYWGQCYPSESIGVFGGMAIDHVAIYLGITGNYSLFLYKDNVTSESNLLATKDFTGSVGWNEIALDNAIPLDITKDLWVVFHTSNSISHPAYFGEYFGNGKEHAHYLWYSFSENITYSLQSEDVSWPIKVHLTDGTFTYNIYRDDMLIAEQQPINTFQDVNLSDGTHNYYIKSYANNWESDASDIVTLSYSTEHRISDAVTIPDNLTLSNYNKYTIESTGILTVTGTLVNNDPAQLILENDAQLIHNSAGVKATVKKHIAPHTTNNNGWYFVASPVSENITPSENNGFLTNDHDLYFYDEPTHYWRNHKEHLVENINQNTNSDFDIEYKKGYLYANGETEGTTLQFPGTLTPSNNDVTINNLSHSSDSQLNGFNLIGNPFACNASLGVDFYVIDNTANKLVLAENGRIITPGEGVFVKASVANNYQVTFSKSNGTRSHTANNCIDLVVSQGCSDFDRARVRFGQGIGMEKYSIDEYGSKLYIPQNGQDFAVAFANGQNEMPVNFKATKNGNYTISIETEDLEAEYLHLIDNMTGADIDLLITPSYTFEARTSDYASRFKLLFDNNGSSTPSIGSGADSETFAYISGGKIIINNEDEATLQIVDMTGRVVVEREAMNCVSTSEMTSGVYVIRLINDQKVMIQKIVIE